ncbi:exonuclease SbcCD subunit D C-terminal domain-containing protein [Paraferrimonas sp. SM1919]|uniref:exonuclease SbcCD subunit D C-terminal domain-containing protein n=1 Tax=Paraferrimonas sp. SM1919 TaxID=2662263 RepID=UPI0013D2A272|nr:exonuclease SbcCD subunit D C-terminal domain-containing protein [Paraferrimonas sp. SM1919]
MRIIHTSDWHLGHQLLGQSRQFEHQHFLNWLLQQIKQHQIQLLIIAGDVFDTGTPASYARTMYHDFLVKVAALGSCQVIVTGGNHDSVAMLHESKSLLTAFNAYVVGGIEADELPVRPIYNDEQLLAVVCAVPYLRPRDLVRSEAGQSIEQKQQQLAEQISQYYKSCYQHAQTLAQDSQAAIIGCGHFTLVGGQVSESVRELYIGTLDALHASLLPDFDYLAMGHLHKAQQIDGKPHLRYSGAPLPLSFSEADKPKSVTMVEFSGKQMTAHKQLQVPISQPLLSLTGSLEQIIAQIVQLQAEPTPERPTWLEVNITQQQYLSDLVERINSHLDDHYFKLLRVKRIQQVNKQVLNTKQLSLDELSEAQIFEARLQLEALSDEQQQSLKQAFKALQLQLAEQQ